MKKLILLWIMILSISLSLSNVFAGDVLITNINLGENQNNIIFDETSDKISDLNIDVWKKLKLVGKEYEIIHIEKTDVTIVNDKIYPTYLLAYMNVNVQTKILDTNTVEVDPYSTNNYKLTYSLKDSFSAYNYTLDEINTNNVPSSCQVARMLKIAKEYGDLSIVTENTEFDFSLENSTDTAKSYQIIESAYYNEYLFISVSPEYIMKKYNFWKALFTFRWDRIGKSYIADVIYPKDQINNFYEIIDITKSVDIVEVGE